jgi:hypothetical protein
MDFNGRRCDAFKLFPDCGRVFISLSRLNWYVKYLHTEDETCLI